MRDPPFITPPMSVWLDLIRIVAAGAVLLGHAVQLGLYSGPYPFSIALQHNAVIVFFVLSGLVIAASAERTQSLRAYAIARAARILPVAFGAIAVSLAVAWLDGQVTGAPAHPWNNAPAIFGAVAFQSESYLPPFVLNPPFWSLCYEVHFYALFGAATYLAGTRRMVWLAGLGIAAGANVLLLLPAWLVGVMLERSPNSNRLPLAWSRVAITLALCSLVVSPVLAPSLFAWLHVAAPWNLGHSLYALSDFLLALCVAAGFVGLHTVSTHGWTVPARWHRAIRTGAGMTFSLYVLHWPLLRLLGIVGLDAGGNPFALAAILLAVIFVSAGFAALTEGNRARLRDWLEAVFASRDRPVPA